MYIVTLILDVIVLNNICKIIILITAIYLKKIIIIIPISNRMRQLC